ADGPEIRQGLEHAEVAVVDIGQLLGEVFEHDGHPVEGGNQPGDPLQYRQVVVLADGAHPQADLAALELHAQGFQVIDGVVVAFLDVLGRDIGHQGGEVLDLVGGVLGQGRGQGAGLELADGEDVEQQHRGVGHGGAAGFADDGGVGDLLRVEGFLDGFHHVDGVFLQAVVAALLAAAPGAVVVHGEAAADVQVAEGRPLLHQVDVVAAGLADAGADVLDVGDL